VAVLVLMMAELAACAGSGIQACNQSPYESTGPCTVGKHKDS